MADADQNDGNDGGAPPKRKSRRLLLLGLPLVALLGGGAAVMFVPAVGDMARGLLGGHGGGETHAEEAPPAKPVFVDIPEMTVTLPNGGRPRQLKIHLALELAKALPEGSKPEELLTPRTYDALVLYLRTLRDAEVEGSLAIDRLRGDLFRRLDLLLGNGMLRDVLITNMVVG